jgi:hypothetical protein
MDDCPHCHTLIDELKSATQSCCSGGDVTRLITIVSLGGRPWHMEKGPLRQRQWLTDVSGRWGRALHIVATPTIIVYGSDGTMLFRQKAFRHAPWWIRSWWSCTIERNDLARNDGP